MQQGITCGGSEVKEGVATDITQTARLYTVGVCDAAFMFAN